MALFFVIGIEYPLPSISILKNSPEKGGDLTGVSINFFAILVFEKYFFSIFALILLIYDLYALEIDFWII